MISALETKVPREVALKLACELTAFLKPHCQKLVVAGSVRRRKPLVSDIEILFIPAFVAERDILDLFGAPHQVNVTERAIRELLFQGFLAKRPNVNGAEAWGEKNKLAIHKDSGISIDLFTATETNWFNYLVCRTGGAANNVRIASAAQRKGWTWNPYGDGFSRPNSVWRAGEHRVVQSEREVFEFMGLPYLEPWER